MDPQFNKERITAMNAKKELGQIIAMRKTNLEHIAKLAKDVPAEVRKRLPDKTESATLDYWYAMVKFGFAIRPPPAEYTKQCVASNYYYAMLITENTANWGDVNISAVVGPIATVVALQFLCGTLKEFKELSELDDARFNEEYANVVFSV